MNVFVFKTSIGSKDILRVDAILSSLLSEYEWSLDLEDCDNVLKIKSKKVKVNSICLRLKTEGFFCEELK